jgi:hypothetical protein
MKWWDALALAGAVPAAFVPPPGRAWTDLDDGSLPGAELIEDDPLALHSVVAAPQSSPACFLDGIQQWKVAAYDGVAPLVRGYAAAAVRRRGPPPGRRPKTILEASREFAVAPLAAMSPERRRLLEQTCPDVVDLAIDTADGLQPARVLELARRVIDGVRQTLVRDLAERAAAALGPDEWLLVDGLLSVSGRLAGHPRALGVIRSHGTQFFDGQNLERALTAPAGHRTSVFRARGAHARNEVYSWYLRLWPWEGHDLLYGLLRIEARPDAATVADASAISGWLLAERAPLATPDARWDRLLYPLHDVETYLKARAPRDLLAVTGSRLPRTGT